MLEAWRIVRAKHAAGAFSGKGAAQFGGRWNSRGVPVVYASATLSLAVLETLVHLNPPVVFHFKVFHLRFDEGLVEPVPSGKLPAEWREEPPPRSTQAIGDDWVRAGRSAMLALPSVIIPTERNYVLNPAHRDFKRIKIGPPEDFTFDTRIEQLVQSAQKE